LKIQNYKQIVFKFQLQVQGTNRTINYHHQSNMLVKQ